MRCQSKVIRIHHTSMPVVHNSEFRNVRLPRTVASKFGYHLLRRRRASQYCRLLYRRSPWSWSCWLLSLEQEIPRCERDLAESDFSWMLVVRSNILDVSCTRPLCTCGTHAMFRIRRTYSGVTRGQICLI